MTTAAQPYRRTVTIHGHQVEEFSDGQHWFDERNVCNRCRDEREAQGKPYRFADTRHSFGVYAGRMCDPCWHDSEFRGARDPSERFDPADAGESFEAD